MGELARESDPMPVFVLKARDNLALGTMRAYHAGCLNSGLPDQAEEVARAIEEVARWREDHRHLCKWPDHRHIPAGEPGSGSERDA